MLKKVHFVNVLIFRITWIMCYKIFYESLLIYFNDIMIYNKFYDDYRVHLKCVEEPLGVRICILI